MRYIKKYEHLDSKYSEKNFTAGTYWRHKNSNIDVIMKIESVIKGKYNFSNNSYDIIYIKIKNNQINNCQISTQSIQSIINNSKAEDHILRPATKEEIDIFNLSLSAEKYNL